MAASITLSKTNGSGDKRALLGDIISHGGDDKDETGPVSTSTMENSILDLDGWPNTALVEGTGIN